MATLPLFSSGDMSLDPLGRGSAAHMTWNFHSHQKSSAWAIRGGDPPAMFLDGFERDGQAEPRSCSVNWRGTVRHHSEKRIEEHGDLRFGNSWAAVGDGNLRQPVTGLRQVHLDLRPLRREAD